MESKLIKEFCRQLKADQQNKAAIKQRLKIALIIGGIIICLMLMIS
jgi:CHASE3 domain sensor protein